MINWFRKNKSEEMPKEQDVPSTQKPDESPKSGLLSRVKQGLSKTRKQVGQGVANLLLGKKVVDEALLEDLETLLLSADFGIDTANYVIRQIEEKLSRKSLSNGEAVYAALKEELIQLIGPLAQPLDTSTHDGPFVILMVGVNGAGKTTTIGKLAKQFLNQGKKVMLAAGDTFRAAAVEQLKAWGERNQVPVIAQHTGADSASVVYDAYQAAINREFDILIADTAGRLHTQSTLMNELKKVKKVLQKLNEKAPHEVMLVLDASIGQNALSQAQQFRDAIDVSGITMTKLDGTARGGILFAIAHQLEIPFRYIGIGEGVDDLRVFDAEQFIDAIFDHDTIQTSE
ncbi:signal recognition particle-docking protein FtsY [Legionella sp. W05-934-2]|jgi:fused signal recognition particle receptor|uniref:signal recognition particle-docking protein FtsY n=1 Tax=Legionella sp. W05-934-2 TaxID=1198649 RepID=UPI003462E615